ncbi:DUF1801 domain-containing protein [Candidatus Enterococcus ferrettii]|uniref:YdhG-like domain-containing protein n=1 Tax=Candidatus Enterococcus ferrettii TaxID=2815324 RepID=A0ABV0EV50_9ENTE|nr:DUF1801 domain-containing protein [Enterococcus sp. 665A]MBO1340393.1 DUF1801 domain-containing protein [Enterococcus sp. 665A]
MPKKIPATDTQAYIEQSPAEAQDILSQLVSLLRKTQPVEETIKWGLPFFLYNEMRANIAAYKAHVSVSFSEDLTPEQVKEAKDLGYATGQKRLNIRFDQSVPEPLIKKIIAKK